MKMRLLGMAVLVALLAAFVPATAGFADEDGDGEAEFDGVIESLPATPGFIGDWVVSGTTVHVTASTEIEQDDGVIAVGASVEVEGIAEADGSITASEVEVEEGAEEDDFGTVEFFGTVQSLPATLGFIGDWVVSGRTVHVTTATEIEQEHGVLAVGVFVEVKGLPEADGSVTASKVEVKGPDDEDEDEDGTVLLTGVVQRVPQGLTGTWRVSKHAVRVGQSTRIVPHGQLQSGATVRVHGRWRLNGSIRATRIVVRG